MTSLDSLRGPQDLRDLGLNGLAALAEEIRDRLISAVPAPRPWTHHRGPEPLRATG